MASTLDFYYQKRIRDRGKQGLIGTLAIAAIFGAIDIYLLTQPLQIGHIVGTWFAGLLCLVVGLMTIWSLIMLCSKDCWEISIDDQQFRWSAPARSEEQSFEVKIDDIRSIDCITSANGLANKSYELMDNSNNLIMLKPSLSGVDIDNLLQQLESLGVDVFHKTQ